MTGSHARRRMGRPHHSKNTLCQLGALLASTGKLQSRQRPLQVWEEGLLLLTMDRVSGTWQQGLRK